MTAGGSQGNADPENPRPTPLYRTMIPISSTLASGLSRVDQTSQKGLRTMPKAQATRGHIRLKVRMALLQSISVDTEHKDLQSGYTVTKLTITASTLSLSTIP